MRPADQLIPGEKSVFDENVGNSRNPADCDVFKKYSKFPGEIHSSVKVNTLTERLDRCKPNFLAKNQLCSNNNSL